MQDEGVRRIEVLLRKARRPQAILVCDHDEAVAGALQLQQRGNDAGHEPHLGQAVDLLIGRFLVQGAVAVDEKNAAVRS